MYNRVKDKKYVIKNFQDASTANSDAGSSGSKNIVGVVKQEIKALVQDDFQKPVSSVAIPRVAIIQLPL